MQGQTLIIALDAAYQAFAGYSRPLKIEAARTRDSEKILATLSSAPLRELTGEQIGPYSGWALTTVGSVADYKHFLPRILEQATAAPEWLGTMPPVIASKLGIAVWRTWPRQEQTAVTDVFLAAWRECIKQHPNEGHNASEWLCGFAGLGEDIKPLLDEWITRTTGNSLLQIANLACDLPVLVSSDQSEQLFWTAVGLNTRNMIVSWLGLPQIKAAFSDAIGIAADDMWYIKQGEEALFGRSQHFVQ